MNLILESQQIPHTSPSRASYGVSIARILEKIDRVITAPHCNMTLIHSYYSLDSKIILMEVLWLCDSIDALVQSKIVVTPLPMHWSCCSLVLSHRYALIEILCQGLSANCFACLVDVNIQYDLASEGDMTTSWIFLSIWKSLGCGKGGHKIIFMSQCIPCRLD